jgi:symplekin
MDHDQQVIQLRDFDQQVLSQPDSAQSFATKSFLETLVDLLDYGLEKNDDGTDAYKEELRTIKIATKAFTTILPTVYKTV